jgi:predicted amidohydrolase YtcJ
MVDHILFNGRIVTHDPNRPRVAAIAITGGRVVAIGDDDEILELAGAHTKRDNLNRHLVLPGLTDAHLHWMWTARILRDLDVFEVPDKQIAVQRVAERASRLAPGEWILGYGWDQNRWPDARFPSAADLDAVSPDNPVYLRSKSAHAFWVNSKALAVCGITRDTPDPDGGVIGRDADGNLTGVLYETAAYLVTRHIPKDSLEDIATVMREAQGLALASGLTGFHDFDDPDCLRALQILRERGHLALRCHKQINLAYLDPAIESGVRFGFGDDWINFGALKMFADGALGPRTAAMIAPYEGEPDNLGVTVLDTETMLRHARKASQNGLPTTIHAIGDAAVRSVLDVFTILRAEEAAQGIPTHQRRHRIEHVQLVHPDDINRLAELDIIGSFQPIHATSDYAMADLYWGERARLGYNARTQIDRGVHVAFGSDSPIDTFKPLEGIYAAVTRRRADGTPGPDGWYPENRLTVDEAVRGYTTGAAYAAGREHRLGCLKPGYLADCVVLNLDMYHVPTDELLEAEVLATMTGGVWRYGGV